MNNPSDDLISFIDSDKKVENAKINSVLREFDPLFGIKTHELSAVPHCSSLPINRKADILRKEISRIELRSAIQNRIGGFFDKDLIWDELNEFASKNKSDRPNGLSSVNSSTTICPLKSCPSSPLMKVSVFWCVKKDLSPSPPLHCVCQSIKYKEPSWYLFTFYSCSSCVSLFD